MPFLARLSEVITGGRDERHGPLVPLLMIATMVTGLVDAISYLELGHVFVANMTGNVRFLGLAVADAQEFSVPASLAAMAAFMAGALAGGRLGAVAGSIARGCWRQACWSISAWSARRSPSRS